MVVVLVLSLFVVVFSGVEIALVVTAALVLTVIVAVVEVAR